MVVEQISTIIGDIEIHGDSEMGFLVWLPGITRPFAFASLDDARAFARQVADAIQSAEEDEKQLRIRFKREIDELAARQETECLEVAERLRGLLEDTQGPEPESAGMAMG